MATTVTVATAAAQSTTSTPSTPIAKALSASPPTKKAGSNSIFLGGIASMVAACTTHPLDLLKVRLQTQISSGGSVLTTVSNIIRNEGILALYAGLSASLLRQATYSTARFGGYEFLKDRAIRASSPHSSELPLYQKISFSLISGAAGGVIGNPADVVNVRMQADGKLPLAERRNYKHAIDGLIRITRENGVLALWRGVGPNVARGMLMTAGQLASYDQFKGWMLHSGIFQDGLTTHFLASTAAGVVATVMTAPVDVVKTRVMNARAGEQLKTLECFGRILKHEGIMGFYKGFVPAFIRLGPHTIVTFITLEKLKQWL